MQHIAQDMALAPPRAPGLIAPERNFPEIDRWDLLRLIEEQQKDLGISDRETAVLRGLFSALPATKITPEMTLVIFASNKELSKRASGVKERTLQRRIDALCDAGLLQRQDSPNRKRYPIRNADGEIIKAYGIDVRPAFEAVFKLREGLRQKKEREAEMTLLTSEIRDICQAIRERLTAVNLAAGDVLDHITKMLRRTTLTVADLNTLLDRVKRIAADLKIPLAGRVPSQKAAPGAFPDQPSGRGEPKPRNRITSDLKTPPDPSQQSTEGPKPPAPNTSKTTRKQDLRSTSETEKMTGSDRQNVGHIEAPSYRNKKRAPKQMDCPQPKWSDFQQISAFFPKEPRTTYDIRDLFDGLAHLLGVSPSTLMEADRRMGTFSVLKKCEEMLSRIQTIRNPTSYLRAVFEGGGRAHA